MNKPLLSLEKITKVYGKGDSAFKALDNIDLSIDDNAFLVISGESGSGKSTLLNVIGGMDRPTGGAFYYNNMSMTNIKAKQLTQYRRNEIGFIFQFYNLVPTLTVLENVEVGATLSQDPEDPQKILKDVGLLSMLDRFPAEISGGQQQRVSIARALASNPKLLLCDEPTGALDSASTKQVLDILVDIHKRLGKTIVLVTHNEVFAKYSTHHVSIKDGKIITHKGG